MAYTKWQSDRVVRVDYEGGICHTWEFASSLIHSNWPIYPNIPTDWTGVCFQKQFWESEFEGLMSADHITSLPCEQVSSTTPNFEIVLIICDHILATTLPPHVKWRCLRSKLLFQEVRSQTPQWVSAQFSNNWKPWLFCFYATELNSGPHCHLRFEEFVPPPRHHSTYTDVVFRTEFWSVGPCCFFQSLSFFSLSLHSVWPRWNKYSFCSLILAPWIVQESPLNCKDIFELGLDLSLNSKVTVTHCDNVGAEHIICMSAIISKTETLSDLQDKLQTVRNTKSGTSWPPHFRQSHNKPKPKWAEHS